MTGTLLHLRLTAVAGATALALFVGAGNARAEPGDCEVTSGSEGGFRYVTLKCAFRREPGEYKVRNTIWERDKPGNYQDLMRLSGRKFFCDLKEGGTTYGTMVANTEVKVSNCQEAGKPRPRQGLFR
jgi:hypothetical protein